MLDGEAHALGGRKLHGGWKHVSLLSDVLSDVIPFRCLYSDVTNMNAIEYDAFISHVVQRRDPALQRSVHRSVLRLPQNLSDPAPQGSSQGSPQGSPQGSMLRLPQNLSYWCSSPGGVWHPHSVHACRRWHALQFEEQRQLERNCTALTTNTTLLGAVLPRLEKRDQPGSWSISPPHVVPIEAGQEPARRYHVVASRDAPSPLDLAVARFYAACLLDLLEHGSRLISALQGAQMLADGGPLRVLDVHRPRGPPGHRIFSNGTRNAARLPTSYMRSREDAHQRTEERRNQPTNRTGTLRYTR